MITHTFSCLNATHRYTWAHLRLQMGIVLIVSFTLYSPEQSPAQETLRTTKEIGRSPLYKQLQGLSLPRVEFRDANLAGALECLKRKAAKHPDGLIEVTYVSTLPDDLMLNSALTLSLTDIPFLEALRYLGELADVKFSIGRKAIVAKMNDRSSDIAAISEEQADSAAARRLPRGLDGVLGEPAKRVQPASTGGRNVYRNMGGAIQKSRSGYVKHRATSGWSVAVDPHNTINVNCSDRLGCRVTRHAPTCPMRGVPNTVQSPKPN